MTEPIESLDENANRLDVLYSKMLNYAAAFAKEFREQHQAFDPARYTPPSFGQWSFGRWLMTKVGVSEKTCWAIIETLERRVATEDRELTQRRLRELAAERKAERARLRAERDAAQAAARAAREAAALAHAAAHPRLQLVPAAPRPAPKRSGPTSGARLERAAHAIAELKAEGKAVTEPEVQRRSGVSASTAHTAVAMERAREAGRAEMNAEWHRQLKKAP